MLSACLAHSKVFDLVSLNHSSRVMQKCVQPEPAHFLCAPRLKAVLSALGKLHSSPSKQTFVSCQIHQAPHKGSRSHDTALINQVLLCAIGCVSSGPRLHSERLIAAISWTSSLQPASSSGLYTSLCCGLLFPSSAVCSKKKRFLGVDCIARFEFAECTQTQCRKTKHNF